MNKKIILAVLTVLLVVAVVLCACAPQVNPNPDPDPNPNPNPDPKPTPDPNPNPNPNPDPGPTTKTILDLYGDVNKAKSATQTITIKNGAFEIAIETLNYNYETGKVTIERKTLNSSDADELYTTTTETKDIEGRNSANLTAANLKDVTETETKLTAKVANANLNAVFGIASTDVQGDASLELVAEGSYIVSIKINYVSANGNTVQIVTAYVY